MLLLWVIALDREGSIIAALIGLIVASLTVSVGAWILLARERRRGSVPSRPTEVLPAQRRIGGEP